MSSRRITAYQRRVTATITACRQDPQYMQAVRHGHALTAKFRAEQLAGDMWVAHNARLAMGHI
jgi:hypothetical protein